MKAPQVLQNYRLHKPPLRQFDDIYLDRATSHVILL
jgi:hypothetical protein